MPMTWQAPEEAMTVCGVTIYHTYRDQDINQPSEYWFTTDRNEDSCFEFDIRSLPVPEGVALGNQKLIIAAAIDCRSLSLSDEAEDQLANYKSSALTATALSADGKCFAIVDIAQWAEQAPAAQIARVCENPVDSDEARSVIQACAENDLDAAKLFHYLASQAVPDDLRTFGAVIDEAALLAHLEKHRADSYWQVMRLLGRAVQVRGTVTETVVIDKAVVAHVLLSDELIESFTDDDEGLDLQALAEDHGFENDAKQALRDKAYRATISAGGHGWRPVHTCDVGVEFSVSTNSKGQAV